MSKLNTEENDPCKGQISTLWLHSSHIFYLIKKLIQTKKYAAKANDFLQK